MKTKTPIAPAAPEGPPLLIDDAHYERLQALAFAAMSRSPETASRLLDEIGRAETRPSERIPANVVNIGSDVTFRDDDSGRIQTVRLVFPNEADIGASRVSVLTPIGTALIGLAEGHRMDWERRDGATGRLTVLKVAGPGQEAPELSAGG